MQHRTNVSSDDHTQQLEIRPVSRAHFLKLAAFTGGAVATGGILTAGSPAVASAAPHSRSQDHDILNYLLVLEYLQASFYEEAVANGALSGQLHRFARVVAGHERDHVHFLRHKLGSQARPSPKFDFGSATSDSNKFTATAMKLEELALGAFVGQGANLTRESVLHVARIASVEGRHAAWVRDMRKELPAPRAADRGLPQGKVTAALRATGFIKSGAS